jgi:hypothetical protein
MKKLFLIFLFISSIIFNCFSEVIFYVGFENEDCGYGKEFIYPNLFRNKREILPTPFVYEEGVIGKSASFSWKRGYPGLLYPVFDNFKTEKGTISLWIKKTGDFFINQYYPKIHIALGRENFNAISIVPVNDPKCSAIEDGKWHHLVYIWDATTKKSKQYLDGNIIGEAIYNEIPKQEVICFGYRLTGSMDELVILDEVLKEEEIKQIYKRYLRGEKVFSLPKPDKVLFPIDISNFADGRPELPEKDINLKSPVLENGKRFLYELSGTWRFQPVIDREIGYEWGYISVPRMWFPNGSFIYEGKQTNIWKGKSINEYKGAWYEKDFILPEKHKGSRVLLKLKRIISDSGIWVSAGNESNIYINKRYIGSIQSKEEKYFDLTDYIFWDKPNRISILNGLPYTKLEKAGIAETPLIEIRENKEIFIGEPIITTSFRNKNLSIELPVKNYTVKNFFLSISGKVYDYRTNQLVEQLPSVEVKLERNFDGEKYITFPVKNLKYWNPENPQLYNLILEVKEKDNIIDISFPTKFGFREVWVENGNIYINGAKLSWRGSSHNYLSSYGFSTTDIKLRKEIGENGDRTLSPSIEFLKSLDICDEEGWIVSYNISIPLDDLEESKKSLKELIKLIGNHPSVCFWQITGNGYVNGPHGHPMQIGGIIPEEIKEKERAYKITEFLNKIDPTRPVFFFRLGVGGNFRSIMHYLGYGTPVQTMEEWPSYWAKTKQEPFAPAEISLALTPEEKLWQKGSNKVVLLEHGARYFGEDVYKKVDEELAKTYQLSDYGFNKWHNSDIRYDIKSYIYERVLRSWRTYGISGYLLHVDGKVSECYTEGKLNKFGETLKKCNSPLLFYIGGKKEDFISKDHNYFEGELIEKSGIIVNDTFHDIKGEIEWQLIDNNNKIITDERKEVFVKQGEILFYPIKFNAPKVKEKSKFYIIGRFKTENETLEDKFSISVFSQSSFSFDKKIALIDSIGETKSILDKMGVPYDIVNFETIDRGLHSLSKYPLLIIGKNSYPQAVEMFNKHMRIDETIKEGLNVVILEQTNRYVAGLKLHNLNSRNVFIRDKSNPLFSGLSNEDLSDWRGESKMLPSYPPWKEGLDFTQENYCKNGQLNSFGERRFWHWSNKGMVATFCFEKPQIGNFKVLLENGFDLLYTPMCEFYYGKGRILFSQLDLIDHYEIEPVANLILNRIIKEYSGPSKKSFYPVCYIGDRKLLDDLKFEFKEGFDGKILYITEKVKEIPDIKDKIEKFLEKGGIILTCIKEELLPILPVKPEVLKMNVYKTEVPDYEIFSGIGISDFYFQGIKEINCVKYEKGIISNPGIIGVIPYKEGKIIFIQIDQDDFSNFWQKSKILRIFSTILTNIGAESKLKVNLCQIGGKGEAEEWLPGYKEVQQINIESPFYLNSALDFDPEEHHVW